MGIEPSCPLSLPTLLPVHVFGMGWMLLSSTAPSAAPSLLLEAPPGGFWGQNFQPGETGCELKVALGGFPALPWVRSSLGRRSEGRRVLGLLLTPRVPCSPLPRGILQKANFSFRNKDQDGACSPIFPSLCSSPPPHSSIPAFPKGEKPAFALLSHFSLKLLWISLGNSAWSIPEPVPTPPKRSPSCPISLLGFIAVVTKTIFFCFLGGNEGKGNEVFFLLLGFLLILPSVGGAEC